MNKVYGLIHRRIDKRWMKESFHGYMEGEISGCMVRWNNQMFKSMDGWMDVLMDNLMNSLTKEISYGIGFSFFT